MIESASSIMNNTFNFSTDASRPTRRVASVKMLKHCSRRGSSSISSRGRGTAASGAAAAAAAGAAGAAAAEAAEGRGSRQQQQQRQQRGGVAGSSSSGSQNSSARMQWDEGKLKQNQGTNDRMAQQ